GPFPAAANRVHTTKRSFGKVDMATATMTTFDLGVNLADPDTFEKGFPHDVFRRLRREAPVYWHERAHARGGQGFFVVSRYEDVRYVGRTPLVFSSEPGITIV